MTPLYREVSFSERGEILSDDAPALVENPEITDLLILSHGWNNNASEARGLYTELTGHLERHLQRIDPGIRLGVLGVLWPSKRFDLPDRQTAQDGPAAGGVDDADPAEVRAALDAALVDLAAMLAPAERTAVEKARARIDRLNLATERASFTRELLSVSVAAQDPDDGFLLDVHEADAETFDELAGLSAEDLEPLPQPAPPLAVAADVMTGAGQDAAGRLDDGSAAGFFGGRSILSIALKLANWTTFYVMKARAGVVGAAGLAPILQRPRRPDLRVHLTGHSFGARLVTAAAHAAPTAAVESISLLQAAFSHYAFSEDWTEGPSVDPGDFRGVLTAGGLRGPMLITHTRADKPVGLAYALASRLRGKVVASAVGDADDPFGGLGSNGAQRTPGTVPLELGDAGTTYSFTAGQVHNLRADGRIKDHGDVRNEAVAWAVASAIAWRRVT